MSQQHSPARLMQYHSINCDADIHSSNLLALCHHRVPIASISGFFHGSSATKLNNPILQEADEEINYNETDSWLVQDPDNKIQDFKGFSYGGISEENSDLMKHNSCTEYQYQNQNKQHAKEKQQQQQEQNQYFNVRLEHENTRNLLSFAPLQVVRWSQHHSFMRTCIVPEATMRDTSNSYARPPKERMKLFSSPSSKMPLQYTPMNREAKVLQYREKKKARKFEKKIQYASRKASADIRPRVRGKFAKRPGMEVEENHAYGIVPSFNFNQ